MKEYMLILISFFAFAALCKRIESNTSSNGSAVTVASSIENAENKSNGNIKSGNQSSKTVIGEFKMIVQSGIYRAEIKSMNRDHLIVDEYFDGEEIAPKLGQTKDAATLLGMDESGIFDYQMTAYVKVPGGKFECAAEIYGAEDERPKFCEEVVVKIDEAFRKKLLTDSDFREKVGVMLGKDMRLDLMSPYLRISDVK